MRLVVAGMFIRVQCPVLEEKIMGNANVAGKKPIAVEVEAGKNYFWCSCGLSANQPFCDGSHKTTDFNPVKWECAEDGKKFFCACKQTSGQPFCDGSHKDLSD